MQEIFNGLDLELNKEKQINISYIESELKIKKDQKIFNYKKNIDNTRININRKKNHNYLKTSCNEKKINLRENIKEKSVKRRKLIVNNFKNKKEKKIIIYQKFLET